MALDIEKVKLVFSGLEQGIHIVKNYVNKKEEKYELALYAIYTATTETKNYISTWGRRKNHDTEKEIQLSKLWNEAGIKLRHIDNDLAQKCIIKADYWANPDEWTQGDIKASKVSLDLVIKEARILLENQA
jgi:hypothetical protein